MYSKDSDFVQRGFNEVGRPSMTEKHRIEAERFIFEARRPKMSGDIVLAVEETRDPSSTTFIFLQRQSLPSDCRYGRVLTLRCLAAYDLRVER